MAPRLEKITRRRALFIGATLLGGAITSRALGGRPPVARWSGHTMGAHAQIELAGLDDREAQPLFAAVEHELDRLEAIFSLYRPESAISVLNRDAALQAPPPEFLEVLTLSAAVHRQTFGLFDPTIQPLFALYATHYSAGNHEPPAADAVEEALARVGIDKLVVEADAVRFQQPGMGLTLNGIAQGYITDKVAALLREAGLSNLLIDMGEIRALGGGHTGAGWRVGVRAGPDDETIAHRFNLTEGAVATSMMLGTTFDANGSVGHIIHPRRGLVRAFTPRATVVATTAAQADALSTAAVLMDADQLAGLRGAGVELYL